MILTKTKNFIISEMKEEDNKGILDVYNSNQDFLLSHVDRKKVSMEWLKQEQKKMKDINFKTLLVKENKNDNIIGFIDICILEECYLSLFMVHSLYKGKGYGKEIYEQLENYLRNTNSKVIKIDVVYNYNESVLQFWKNKGFKETEKVKLKWSDKLLDVIVLKKNL